MINERINTSVTVCTCMSLTRCRVSGIEETLNRQATELKSLSDDVSAMETDLEQLLMKLSQLDPESITCNNP